MSSAEKVAAPTAELAAAKIDESNKQIEDEDVVDPWTVSSKSDTGINYEKLIGYYLFCLFSCLEL